MSKHNSNLEFRVIPSLHFLYEVNENGTIFRNVKSKKQLKITLDMHHSNTGYYCTFVNIKGSVKRVMIHSVVAECWLGKRPDGMEIDHIDRNSHNNAYTNLRYVNHSQQMKNRVLSQRLIETATSNCNRYTMMYVAKPVSIESEDRLDERQFPSMMSCAEYLGKVYQMPAETIRRKLKKRRKRIFDYNVTYHSKCTD